MQLPADTNATEESLNNLLAQLEEMEDLPSPPDIVTRIIELLRDPESDIKELMDTLTKDPALVAKILKTANSAMYARRREVTNLAGRPEHEATCRDLKDRIFAWLFETSDVIPWDDDPRMEPALLATWLPGAERLSDL